MMTPSNETEITHTPIAAKARSGSLKQNQWATTPSCLDSIIYTVWNSTDDYNKVASHVGVPPTECCNIYCSRLFPFCGGICVLNEMATEVKQRYEVVHNLQHQEIPCWVQCCPEITWRQIVRDHDLRVGGTMEPAARRMSRG